jgi:glycosyltransferase involved in cell wall biosynthesis
VHTHSTRPNRTARPVALRRGLPVVSHYHNQYDDKWTTPELRAVERALARAGAGVVACSAAVRDHLVHRLDLVPDSVTVVPNGVDVERFRGGDGGRVRAELGLAPGRPLLLAVGRLCPQKAPADLLHAVRVLLDRQPAAVLALAGAPDQPAAAVELRDLAGRLGVADRVRFLGYREDMADVYAAADVVVLASRWEGFGLVLLEAMAAGRPVVATRVGGIPEVVGAGLPHAPAALLVPPGEPAALAAAVDQVVRVPALAGTLTVRGAERVRDFSWDTAAARVDALHRRVAGATAGAGAAR